MATSDGIWSLTLKPRRFIDWLPVEAIDEWLARRIASDRKPAHSPLPPLPWWYMLWSKIAFKMTWEWEEFEDEEEEEEKEV